MPYRAVAPDAATCLPQILDDQPETLVSLPQLRSELALQVILSSSVPLNRSDICGARHVIDLLRHGDENGVYHLIAAGNLPVIMEEGAGSLYDWWKASKSRIAHIAHIDEDYVRTISERLEQNNAFRLSFRLGNTASDYYKLLNAALDSESYRLRCRLLDTKWVAALEACIRQFDSRQETISRAQLYRQLNIGLTSEKPDHHYTDREKAMKRLIDACYIANIPLHQSFSYSVRENHVPLFFHGPTASQSSKRRRWRLRRTRFVSDLPDLSTVHFGSLVEAMQKASSLRTDYLSRVQNLRSHAPGTSQLSQLFDAAGQYMDDLFRQLHRISPSRTGAIFCLSAEQAGPVEAFSMQIWPDNSYQPVHSTLCFATGSSPDHLSPMAQTSQDWGNRG